MISKAELAKKTNVPLATMTRIEQDLPCSLNHSITLGLIKTGLGRNEIIQDSAKMNIEGLSYAERLCSKDNQCFNVVSNYRRVIFNQFIQLSFIS